MMEDNVNIEQEQQPEVVKVTKDDMRKVYWRCFFDMSSINYERFQAMGFTFAITPALKRLYPDKERRAEAMKRHMKMYNSHPWMLSPIVGTTIAMEEQHAAGTDMDETINNVKVGLMGPFAGIGDSLFWGTLRTILGGIGAGIAQETTSIFGAVLFLVAWNICNFGFRSWSLNYGYKFGTNMLKDMRKTNIIQKVTEGSAVLGLMVLGVLVAQWVGITTGLSYTIAGAEEPIMLQAELDKIVPSLLPLLATMGLVQLLRKKIRPNRLILGIFIVAFAVAILNQVTGLSFINAG